MNNYALWHSLILPIIIIFLRLCTLQNLIYGSALKTMNIAIDARHKNLCLVAIVTLSVNKFRSHDDASTHISQPTIEIKIIF